jgi:hypothetical protein
MGEIAEAMLDGTMCQCCGEYLGTDAGYPITCAGCKAEERREARVPRFDRYAIKDNPKIAKPSDPVRHGDKMSCPFCVKRVKVTGFGQHMLDQHRDKWPKQ